jgi:4-diphosphocytidyl-2-C-methyl-D-erythritol kinase
VAERTTYTDVYSASPLIERAPGKVNLCLFLGPVRSGDGRHELVTVYESVTLADELTLNVLREGARDEVLCPGVRGPNLVTAALTALRARGWAAPPVRIEIAKRIPVTAGMGGGSADAAAAVRLARRVSPIPETVIAEIAATLGADVPAQLSPGLSLGTGAGEIVEPLPPLEAHAFAIVPLPDRYLSTPAVYAEADRLGLGRPREELATLASGWQERIGVNDLEAAARSLCPPIDEALRAVSEAGADRVFVCGSGPTCAGLWWGAEAHERAEAAVSTLVPAFPDATAALPVASIGHNSPEVR